MGHYLSLDDLQLIFGATRERLSRERGEILSLAPLPPGFNPDSYSFAYLRAERFGLDAILERLKEVAWLPLHIDPQAEFLQGNKGAMKKWLAAPTPEAPSASHFGNDFAHALTRVALIFGWESAEFHSAASRLGTLFHDLSCLIGLIFYGTWMAENRIPGLVVSDPSDLGLLAKELSALALPPPQSGNETNEKQGKTGRRRGKPHLRVIENSNWPGGSGHPPS